MVPSWVTALAAFAMPSTIAALVYLVVPSRRSMPYGSLILLAIASTIPTEIVEEQMRGVLSGIADPALAAVAKGFLWGAVPEQFFRISAFLLWLATLRDRQPRDALFGAVASAMICDVIANVFVFNNAASDVGDWLQMVVVRSFLANPSSAATAFVVGTWTAVVIADPHCKALPTIIGACAASMLADGLWNTAALLASTRWEAPDLWPWVATRCLPILLASIAVQIAVIVPAIRALNRSQVRFVWPMSPSLR